MVSEGERAPEFALPALVDGAFEEVSLADYRGEVAVLAFYPADFNPCCSWGTTDLDGLVRIGEEQGVPVVGVSGDSVYSHRAFAAEYDLDIPLLADVDGRVAAEYGVGVDESEGYGTRRAVFVVDDGTVAFAWRTDDLGAFPPVEEVRAAVETARADTALDGEIPPTGAESESGADDSGALIDDDELAEIAAEVQAQTQREHGGGGGHGGDGGHGGGGGHGGDGGHGGGDSQRARPERERTTDAQAPDTGGTDDPFDLTDPSNDGNDGDDSNDRDGDGTRDGDDGTDGLFGDDDHGVPDSL